ncbi:MAG TPA: rhomboid family intramembrane serine protease [Bryobacteraceae bacterium]|jgi:membrane associated rhomboid family serine protease|nr:rhomboid family intramembrane serine protease [Bryobacteraceae bacterium]
MIPLRSTERAYSAATVTASLIAVNTIIFLYEVMLPPSELNHLVREFGIVPDRLWLASIFTSMFLHGGWLHLIGNMLFLWVFGRNIEDLIGGAKYLFFYLLCGVLAAVVHIIFNPYSRVPTIGASGAIAGVMGAYLVKFPRARIITLVPIFFFVTTMELPAAFLLLWWFAIQFFNGFGSLGENDFSGGGTAFFAHIGGFVAGMLLIRFFPPRQRFRSWYVED